MSEKNSICFETQNPPVILAVKDLQLKKSHNNRKKNPIRLQKSKPPKNSVKIKPTIINIHYKWALILTIFCFFIIGPVWALYKTSELRRLIKRQELDAAERLSVKMSTVLVLSTIIGAVAWAGLLFCSVGLLLTGILLEKQYI
ncbi:unnamed protein product [Rotaria socialis]|uniref:Uncharacterized protein n=1 Tax=Rotaria socialis TaxID=392032 RepID=A0A817YVM7_9BILA|nr:unnamed protein product [Rotaria socialis]CAF3383035.1 unnamed protein product [Rotaria socialis]CAF3427801.1 unnamed protein product [Rotaria socialis]CAF3471871.1 unnamed protein product [Rotaria socialis]CAF3480879.1 unnamed protein product [Rotaria socialis]